MKLKLICCEVFMREACLQIANTKNVVDPEFTPKGAHENSNFLREIIQNKIDSVKEEEGYDAIILGFGLCGNAIDGLKSRHIPLVVPRAHDCCTLFLGSKKKFMDNFKDNLSAEWSSAGYMERGGSYLRETDTGKLLGLDKSYQEYVEQYGEENAAFIWETLYPDVKQNNLFYIDIKELSYLGYKEKMINYAKEQNKEITIIDGDMRLIKDLIDGNWNDDEFLYVPANRRVRAIYDHEAIVDIDK